MGSQPQGYEMEIYDELSKQWIGVHWTKIIDHKLLPYLLLGQWLINVRKSGLNVGE